MKNRNLLIIFSATVLMVATAATMTDTGKSGKADSPGEGNCSQCHNNTTVNTGGGSVSITTNIPGNTYTPGQTYQISVTVSEASKLLFGLGVEALNASNTNAGTLIITNSTETHLMTAGNGRTSVTHMLNGGLVTTAGSKTFAFNWMAPATDIGYVKFYVASVAASADADETNDNAYTTFKSISSPTVTATEDLAGNFQFSVFPNPVKDMIHFNFPSNAKSGNVKAELYSLTGQKAVDLFNGTMGDVVSQPIAVPSSLANGIYFLRMEQDNQMAVRKVLIQR